MEARIEKIVEDLKAVVRGEVYGDDLHRVMYATGACIFEQKPLVVVVPRDRDDVVAAVGYAAAEDIPLTARGAASGRCGQALGPGLILDFSKFFRTIGPLDEETGRVTVQPGVVLSALNKALAPNGRFFPPDPSSGSFCTLGGMIGTNASGPRSVKYGMTRDWLESVEAVLADGTVVRTRPLRADSPAYDDLASSGSPEGLLYSGVRKICASYAQALEARRPTVKKDSMGYNLWRTMEGDVVDLAQLLCGSEGTLACITEATLKTAPMPAHTATALLFCDSLEKVGDAVLALLEHGPSMLEIMEKVLLETARKEDRALDKLLPPDAEITFLVEVEGESAKACREALADIEERLVGQTRLATGMVAPAEAAEQKKLIQVRKASASILNRIHGGRRPAAFIEDAAVHPQLLAKFLMGLREIFSELGVVAHMFGHAGSGNIHVNPLLNMKDAGEVALMEELASRAHELTLALGGTLSAEHGDGLARTAYLKEAMGELYPALVEVKDLFDPRRIMNPGKIIADEPVPFTTQLRYGPEYKWVETVSAFDTEKLRLEVEKCHGCGACRDYCPVAVATGDERANARSKANLLRGVISGELDSGVLVSDEFKAVMDLCVNCQLCLTRCPSKIDIPGLCVEARSHYVAERGQSLQNTLLGAAGFTSWLGSLTAPLSNWANRLAPLRACMEMVSGIHRRRNLPVFHRKTFNDWFRRHRSVGQKTVVYFPGCFGVYNDPEGEARAAVEVLEANGFQVLVPEVKCCGIGKLTVGSKKALVPEAAYNVRLLYDYVRRGSHVLFSAPSCCLAVKRDYPELLGTREAEEVAEACSDIIEFLWRLYEEGNLNTDFAPVPLVVTYHNPCHSEALGVVDQPVSLMRLIPGVEVRDLGEDTCCGIAGTFGFKTQHYDQAMAMGEPLFEHLQATEAPVALTTCGTCKLQMEHATDMEVLHPLGLLARAYAGTEGR
ncbi:MAG: anaerobic glycerol-3-phosphate dehydrogenase subunit C [Nitrospinae bacterium]|nr:anaerobic glycerol-3-phosphate dehydrogenase subunit C [Nitrospinota bacterium]